MRAFFAIILTLFFGMNLFATVQIPDKIIYNGKEYSLHSNPLETYFEKFPDKKPESQIMSTALWRGYVATFEVRDNQLFLKDIEILYQDTTSNEIIAPNKLKSVINEVFPNQENIKIDWFTGLLVIPHGKPENYIHMGYASTYEDYVLLEIDKGDLKKEKHFNHKEYEQFKKKQFQAFKKTDEYKKIKAELKKEGGDSDKFIDKFLRDFVIEYTSKMLTE